MYTATFSHTNSAFPSQGFPMNTAARMAISAYQQVEVDNKVLDASPHELIAMLYDAALAALKLAKACMENGDLGGRGKAISKAIGIIDEGLKASLNLESGGELAANMDALYDYMGERLLQATLKNDITLIDEVSRLLTEMKLAWDGIGERKPQADGREPEPTDTPVSVSGRA
jgi:flagellar protein FliS